MSQNERRPSRKKGKVARRRNPKSQETKRERRRNPRQELETLIVESGLAHPEALSRNLVETVAEYLRTDSDAVRWDPTSGRPIILSRAVSETGQKLVKLRELLSCMLSPGMPDTSWLGNCPPAAARRRNPAFFGVHLTEDDVEIDEFDDDYDDEEGDDE